MSIVDNCENCDAHCCRHVATQLDTPKTKGDFDIIRWYLLHENIWVSIDLSDNWLLEFRTPCRNISDDYRCGDYSNRPKICREYPSEKELCERQTEKPSYKYLFTNEKEFLNYLDSKKIDWRFKK